MSAGIVVIGGGVIGVACAHFLERAGHRVTLIDRGRIGGGCSHANCGYVCPSHVLPLAGPGVLIPTLREVVKRNGPLMIRPRLDPALWAWLWYFARRCNRRDQFAAGRAIQTLLESSRSLYGGLFASGELAAEWREDGLLFVFRRADAMDHYGDTNRLLSEHFAMPAERWGTAELAEREPALRNDLAGAWYYRRDAHLRPDALMRSWRDLLVRRGVDVREGVAFTGFERVGRRVRAIVTDQGTIPTEAAVVAAGAWTPLLAAALGVRVPIEPGKGYSLTYDRADGGPILPMIFEEDHVAVTPFADGLRIGSTMEFAGYDDTLNVRRLAVLTDGAAKYLRTVPAGPPRESWWGWRPMTPDGLPVIGPAPVADNVLIAAGHGMLGLSMAPATGRLVAELVGGEPHVDPRPYRLRS